MNAKNLIEAFGGLEAGAKPAAPAVDVIEDMGRLGGLVGLIPNPEGADRGYWVSVAHAVWGASEGSEEGFDAFDEWAGKWEGGGNDPDANRRLWDGISGSGVGRGWLKREADRAAPEGLDAWMADEAASAFDDGEEPSKELLAGLPAVAAGGGALAIDPVQRQVADGIVSGWRGRLGFNHDSGCWHRFGGAAWEPLPKSVKAGFVLAEEWAAANYHLLSPGDFKAVSKANFYDGVESILRQRLMVRQADFDVDPWLLGTPLGTVDLRTGVLRGARGAEMISKLCAVGPSVGEDCPRWKRFIMEICKGDLASGTFLRQWFGYCLTGDVSEQVFLFLYGPGGNGKSVLVDTVAWVMGDYFRKPVDDLYVKKSGHARHLQEIAMLAGARMVTISEVPTGSSWDEARLKQHTGGGPVTANFMRENAFSFVPAFKITALGNHQPTFPGGMDPAIRRRFKMMLLDFVPKVVDRKLEQVLRLEAPGILRWMLNGLCDLKVGWHQTGLMFPKSVEDATDEYVADQDILARWLGDRIEQQPGTLTAVEGLHRDWIEYRNAQGEHVDLYSSVKSFVTEMDRRGFSRARTMAARGYRGIVLKTKRNTAFDDE